MINLLPSEYAERVHFGLQNNLLKSWLIGVLTAIAGAGVIIAAGSAYLTHQSDNYQDSIAKTKTELQAQNLSGVQKNADEISGDIKVINQVLSQEIKFSDLMTSIGRLMPPGTVLTSLSLTSDVAGSVDLNAGSIDPPGAAQIAVNLSDTSKDLFSKVDIINVNCANEVKSIYKCNVVLRALFSKHAQTRFLSVPKGGEL